MNSHDEVEGSFLYPQDFSTNHGSVSLTRDRYQLFLNENRMSKRRNHEMYPLSAVLLLEAPNYYLGEEKHFPMTAAIALQMHLQLADRDKKQ